MPRSLQAAQMLRPAERGILTSRCFVDPIWPHADPRARPWCRKVRCAKVAKENRKWELTGFAAASSMKLTHGTLFATRFFRRSMRAFSNICLLLASRFFFAKAPTWAIARRIANRSPSSRRRTPL